MADWLDQGTEIGRYRIEAEVGRGGMGIVYRARDLTLDRPVALKMLAPHLHHDATALARFRREAASVANLQHPHIATVFDFGDYHDQPFIVFEWIEGRALKAILETDRPLPLDRTLRLIGQLASALDYAHQRGVIHRDIKPANILVDANDQAILVDFGLAWLAAAPAITTSGSMFGTPRYIAPDQIRGGPVDGRADQYSLAVVVYEMLAGQAPFEDEAAPTLFQKHLFETPPPITEINPNLPGGIEAALLKALSKDPEQRFATLREFSDELRRHAPPAPTPSIPAKTLRQIWRVIGAVGLIGLLIVLALGAFQSLGSTAAPAPTATTSIESPGPTSSETLVPDTPTPEPTATEAAPEEEAPPEPTPTPITPVPLAPPIDGGSWGLSGGDVAHSGFVREGLAQLNTANTWRRDVRSSDGTNIVVVGSKVIMGVGGPYLRALDWSTGLTEWETQIVTDVVGTPSAFAGNFITETLVVFPAADGRLYALRVDSGEEAWHAPDEPNGVMYGGAIVLDDQLLAATDSGHVFAFDARSGDIAADLDLSDLDQFYWPVSIMNGALLLAGGSQAVHRINVDNGERQWVAETIGSPTSAPCVAEDAGLVFSGTEQGWVHAFGLDDGERRWRIRASSKIAGLAHDDQRVYATATDGSVYAWRMDSGEEAWTLNSGSGLDAAPLTDGNFVLIATHDGELRYIDAASGREATDRKIQLYEWTGNTPAIAGGWLFVRAYNVFGFGP